MSCLVVTTSGFLPRAAALMFLFFVALPQSALSETEPVVPAPTEAPPAKTIDEGEHSQITVHGKRRIPARGSSDFAIPREILTAAPHQTAADVLSTAPGMYVAKTEGDSVAHHIFLRGFDADHGQDIELSVGPVPINQPAHLHGQGYADLNFIIPEVVRSVRVTEGVYDPRQGDFAVAGSANFDLGVRERGMLSRSTTGSFGSMRQLVLWAPEGECEESFTAVQFSRSNGFGMNRGSSSASALAQQELILPNDIRALAQLSLHHSRAGLAGLLRRDDIDSGSVGFYDSYPDPSASSQGAFATRAHASLSLEKRHETGARSGMALWLMSVDFRARQNFTGYLQRSRENPDWVGQGDLIEQGNKDVGIGGRLFHRTQRYEAFAWLAGSGELGAIFRKDSIDQAQNLLKAPQNETWDRRVDAQIQAIDIGAYGDLDLHIGKKLKLRGGFRVDALAYDIDDALGNFTPAFRKANHITGFRRTAAGLTAGPRVTVEYQAIKGLQLLASYGEGYRSPQARQLEEGEQAPFAKVRAVETGFRLDREGEEHFALSGSAFATVLSSDLAFDPQEGRLERIGPTSRKGLATHLVAHPYHWLLLAGSLTYVHATLDAPPTATAENPTPAYKSGQLLPYVPPVVARADGSATRELATMENSPVNGRLGLGFSWLSGRPLPYGQTSKSFALLDPTANLSWKAFELSVDVYNVLNKQYAAMEYALVSNWQTQTVPSLVPARHISAGAPRTILASLNIRF